MSYVTLFEGKTPIEKLWLLMDLRAELDFWSTKVIVFGVG